MTDSGVSEGALHEMVDTSSVADSVCDCPPDLVDQNRTDTPASHAATKGSYETAEIVMCSSEARPQGKQCQLVVQALRAMMCHYAAVGLVPCPESAQAVAYVARPRVSSAAWCSTHDSRDAIVSGFALAVKATLEKERRLTAELHPAIRSNNLAAVELLLREGASACGCDQFGWTPLHGASMYGSADLCSLLLDSRANPNALNAVSVW
eukprot:CAMPEP_0117537866 /NCGR_PEP_ID=MMETSP0784-20121206/42188_1 /TAXON_ID=39447 /ORGANISM="" /LENGTH=207 /DNA_ID=CAMNT_0005334471 /DNA_START=75 /DNA_END=695 /DNA_ORIENTATION=-